MADLILNITIPEAAIPRLKTALNVSTKAEFEALLKGFIKQQAVNNEVSQAEATQKAKVQAEESAIATKMQAAKTKAESEIVLT